KFARHLRRNLLGFSLRTYSTYTLAEFFTAVALINTNVILLQKLFFTQIRPHIEGSPNEHTICQEERINLLTHLEDQIILGIERVRLIFLFEYVASFALNALVDHGCDRV